MIINITISLEFNEGVKVDATEIPTQLVAIAKQAGCSDARIVAMQRIDPKLNVVYATANKGGNQAHFYNRNGVLLGFSEDEENYALPDTVFYGSHKESFEEVSAEDLRDAVDLDYTSFAEVDKYQGYLMSGLPEQPILPDLD